MIHYGDHSLVEEGCPDQAAVACILLSTIHSLLAEEAREVVTTHRLLQAHGMIRSVLATVRLEEEVAGFREVLAA